MTLRTESKPGISLSAESTTWISWLRTVAILGVIAIHSVGFDAIPEDARSTVHGTLAIWLDIGAVFAVPVFVMLSGALMLDPRRYTDHATFLRKRAARLLPALIFWHLWYWVLVSYKNGEALPWRDFVVRTANGNLYTALYFFWIIIGLALLTPVLIGFIGTSSRTAILMAGTGFALIPALSLATLRIRGAPVVLADTAWTWWLGYLGLYILGWGLRGVRVRSGWLVLLTAVTLFLGAVGCWQWRNAEAPAWLQTISPLSYYGIGTILFSIGVYLVAQSLIQPDGVLRFLCRGRAAKLGMTLGGATLGVFGFHLTIIWLLPRLGIGGDELAAGALEPLLLRLVVTIVVSYSVVLVLRRVPLIRAVL